ncbi:MAG: hypothetical protein IKC74_01640 [Clostridia bacterium]|nr:hypothetical protein [Clostridia bacterium]
MRFEYGECYEVDWVMENTSPLSLDECHRQYLRRAVKKGGYNVLNEFTDNEVRAVAAAIEYTVELLERLVAGQINGNQSIIHLKRRIEILKKAHKRLAGLVAL